MKKILLVGCGRLGYRYLQAINNLDFDFECIVIEKKINLRNKLKKNFSQKFKFYSKIPSDNKKFNLCIVATQAKDRSFAVSNINNQITCYNWLLEKNLAVSSLELDHLKKELNNKNVWINTCLRIFKIFKFLKEQQNKIEYSKVTGKNWLLTSNIIHFIDLFSWIFNTKLKKMVFSNSSKWFYNSKNKTWDLYGSVLISFENNKTLKVEHFKQKNKIITTNIIVKTKKDKIKIDQLNYEIYKNNKKIKIKQTYPYLSIYMTKIIQKIIFTKNCNLPNLKSVFNDHKIFLQELEKNFSKSIKNKKLVIN